jgi:phospholipid/cholesterol/gamma-HCH transport system substrate-binding protein
MKKEVKIGLLIVVSVALLFFGVNYLKGVNIFNPSNNFKIAFERIDGLATANAVTARGYKVGQVHSISYDFSKTPSFTVEITIDDGLQLPQGTQIELYDSDIMGTKALEIKFPETPSCAFYKPGDVVPGTVAVGMLGKAAEMLPSVDGIMLQVDSLLTEIRVLVNDTALQQSLVSLQNSMASLETTMGGMNRMANSQLPQLLGSVETSVANFAQISTNLKGIDFQQTFNSLNGTVSNLQTLTNKMNSTEGSLGALLNDKTLYNNMSNTMNSANNLLLDFKQNPKRYVHFSVFGKSDKGSTEVVE